MAKRWIAVRASAVLAIAGSVATLVLGGFMLFSMLAASSRRDMPASPFPLVAIGIVMAALFAILSAWGIATAIGIFRRRQWARISIMIFAVLLTFMGLSAGLTILFMTMPAQEEVSPRIMDVMRWSMSGFYGILAAIGIWWLALFNLGTTKEYFGQAASSEPPARPLSVLVIGWYLLISSLLMLVPAAIGLPAFVCGAAISGWGAMAVYAAFAAAQIFLGTGLLRFRELARVGAIGYFAFAALNALLTLAPPGFDARMQTVQKAMPRFFPPDAPMPVPQPAWMLVLPGIVFAALPIWFLIRQRAAFQRPAPPPVV